MTCFGHKKIFLITLIMDFLLLGGFIAISVLMRGSASMACHSAEFSSSITSSSNNFPSNIYGSGGRNGNLPEILCVLDRSVFALAVILRYCTHSSYFLGTSTTIFLSLSFLVTLLLSYLALKNHRENRAFGPGPANGYSTRNNPAPRSWKHNPFNKVSEETAGAHGAEMSGAAAGMAPYDSGYRHQPPELGSGYKNSRRVPALNAPEEPGSRVSADNRKVAPHQMF